jgi:uncharacterized protein GlcG (DUF336 family)
MKSSARKITPEEYILGALSPDERLDAALRVAREAFRAATVTVADIDAAVRKVRRKHHAQTHAKASRRR